MLTAYRLDVSSLHGKQIVPVHMLLYVFIYSPADLLPRSASGPPDSSCFRSPVFNAMFNHNMRESETMALSIEDLDMDTVKDMLRYTYCSSFPEDYYLY
jgi:hypothetical protein